MYILGIWDGHDSGAAIIKGDQILVAINKERLTRRKLEIHFPEKSIRACMDYLKLTPLDISQVAVSTCDFSKTLARLFPYTKEEYYMIRRRKKAPGRISSVKKRAKYKLTEYGAGLLTKRISERCVRKSLDRLGFDRYQVHMVDHHLCHATAVAFCSNFDECLVVSIDGIGDALSGTFSTFSGAKLSRKSVISGRNISPIRILRGNHVF